eukprot:gene6417-8834_t
MKASSSYYYVVTSQKSTAVSHSIVCQLLNPIESGTMNTANERHLILAKGNHLEIFLLELSGPSLLLDSVVFGSIKCLDYFRPHGSTHDLLFILTERKIFSILEYDAINNRLITKSVGNLKEKFGKDVELGQTLFIDPDNKVIGMQLYEGQIKIIPIESKEPFSLSLEYSNVIDLKFLYGCARPTLCVLYEDKRRCRHVRTLVLEINDRELSPGPWTHNNVEYQASLIIPVNAPAYGIVLVGSTTITYLNGTGNIQTIAMSHTQVTSFTRISNDGCRFLMGDSQGLLFVVNLKLDNSRVSGITIDLLGTTNIAEAISYLDHGIVFIGSSFGDSQLVKLLPMKDDRGSNIEVLETYTNIGPILDMCYVDSEKQGGRSQLVTCSGAYKDSTLRVIRSGIGIAEQASIDVSGIKGLWSVRLSENDEYDKYLIQSFIGETRILSIENEELSEIEIDGFNSQMQTILCKNTISGTMIQVTASSVRLIDCQSFQLLSEYTSSKTITVATANLEQIIVAISGGGLLYLEIDKTTRSIIEIASVQLDQDVACISISPPTSESNQISNEMEVDSDSSSTGTRSSLVAIGMWTDNTSRLLALPTLQELYRIVLSSQTQTRDIIIIDLNSKTYLMVGLGDGTFISYIVDYSSGLPILTNKRNAVLGTHPISFSTFKNAGNLCVFAACDRPTIIYSKNGKLLFSNLNIQQTEIISMAPFHSELFPDCLAMSSESSLIIGNAEEIQKLHIQTIPIGEHARRIVHNANAGIYAVCSEKVTMSDRGFESNHRILFLDDGSMDLKGCFDLDMLEQGISCISCFLDQNIYSNTSNSKSNNDGNKSSTPNNGTEYIIVGTVYVINDEIEPSKGRILVFEITKDRKISLICEKDTKDAVYSLASVNGRLAAAIGSKVQIYKWVSKDDSSAGNFSSSPELQNECGHHGHITALYLKAHGDFLLVGDVMRSVTLLQYRAAESILEEVARDFNANYMRAIEIIDNGDNMLGSDDFGNIFVLRRQTDAANDEERLKLEGKAEFYMDEYINVFRKGSICNQPSYEIEAISSNSNAITNSVTGNHISTFVSILDNNYSSVTGFPIGSNSILYGTITGSIGNIISLNEDSYRFFHAIERSMRNRTLAIGDPNHFEWRSFQNSLRTSPQRNMIDGDLVEMLLELDKEEWNSIAKEVNDELNNYLITMNAKVNGSDNNIIGTAENAFAGLLAQDKVSLSVEDIIRRVEDIARLH